MDAKKLKNAKIFGTLGIILTLLSGIPYIGFIFGVAGLVLYLIANKYLAEITDRPQIFSDTLKGILVSIIGGAMGFVIMFVGMANNASILTLAGLATLYTAVVMSGFFYKNVFYSLRDYFKNDLFKWAGLLIFWGYIGAIIGIGLIVAFVGWILAAVAYYTIPDISVEKSSE